MSKIIEENLTRFDVLLPESGSWVHLFHYCEERGKIIMFTQLEKRFVHNHSEEGTVIFVYEENFTDPIRRLITKDEYDHYYYEQSQLLPSERLN